MHDRVGQREIIFDSFRDLLQTVIELTNIKPYQSPEQTKARAAKATPWRIWPHNWLLFVVLVLAIGVPSLFIPSIEMFKGTMSLGRAPVAAAYFGMFMPEYCTIALPIALAHLIGTIIIASMVDTLIYKRWSR